jgi:hypothetical protein
MSKQSGETAVNRTGLVVSGSQNSGNHLVSGNGFVSGNMPDHDLSCTGKDYARELVAGTWFGLSVLNRGAADLSSISVFQRAQDYYDHPRWFS